MEETLRKRFTQETSRTSLLKKIHIHEINNLIESMVEQFFDHMLSSTRIIKHTVTDLWRTCHEPGFIEPTNIMGQPCRIWLSAPCPRKFTDMVKHWLKSTFGTGLVTWLGCRWHLVTLLKCFLNPAPGAASNLHELHPWALGPKHWGVRP